MNNEVAVYEFQNSIVHTMLDEQNEPLFCLVDVCEALELPSLSKIALQIRAEFECSNLKIGYIFDMFQRKCAAPFITEPQLYFVIMHSRSKRAREFRQWICDDVLPAIRKTVLDAAIEELTLNKPDFLINALTELKKVRTERDEAIRTKAEMGDLLNSIRQMIDKAL